MSSFTYGVTVHRLARWKVQLNTRSHTKVPERVFHLRGRKGREIQIPILSKYLGIFLFVKIKEGKIFQRESEGGILGEGGGGERKEIYSQRKQRTRKIV